MAAQWPQHTARQHLNQAPNSHTTKMCKNIHEENPETHVLFFTTRDGADMTHMMRGWKHLGTFHFHSALLRSFTSQTVQN